MTGTAGRPGAVPNGSDAPDLRARPEHRQKPLKSSGFSPFRLPAKARENSLRLAGHPRVALLNDALLRGLSGPSSGRIAQLVEQLTLNQRVPGSSPGAPTKPKALFLNKLEERSPRTKRVSCDAFCDRTSHAVRRVDGVLLRFLSYLGGKKRGTSHLRVCLDQVLIGPRCKALVGAR
jgi:hypothetical protein